MRNLLFEFGYTVRELRRAPGYALVIVLTLAVGIGLNAAIFSVVDNVLLRPLGYRDADRIVALRTHFISEGRSIPRIGGDDWVDVSHQVKGLESTAFYQSFEDGIELNGAATYLPIAVVGPTFGSVLGVKPIVGTLFSVSDSETNEALVSASFAHTYFGSAQAALGRTIGYLSAPRIVVGVLPDGFSFPGKTQVWFSIPKPRTASRTSYSQNAVAKRRVGISSKELAAELATFSGRLQQQYPEDHNKSIESVSLQEQLVGKVRPVLRLLMGSVAVILLLVCANITHLQLVRATRLVRAVGIRTALGASRFRLAIRVLFESAVLAIAGGIGALLLAYPAIRILVRIAPPDVPRLAEIHLNVHVFIFSLILGVLLMSITALLPVWRGWHIDPASVLRQDASRGTENRGTLRLRNGLVVIQIALTLMLTAGALLLTRELIQEAHVDLGFRPDTLVTLDTHSIAGNTIPDLPAGASAESKAEAIRIAEKNLTQLNAVLDSVVTVPGVASASAIDSAPMSGGSNSVSYAIEGRQVFAPPYTDLPIAEVSAVSANVFRTLGTPLLHGRNLSPQGRLNTPMVVLINEALARKVFRAEDPIGKRVMCGLDVAGGAWWTIIGVVADIRNASPGQPAMPSFYVPVEQHPYVAADMQILVRSRVDSAAILKSLERQLERTHPEIAVKGTTMREDIGETQRPERFRTLLFSAFAGVSSLLAIIGIYGVTAYTVAQRRFEFGLRVALGSNRPQLFALVLRSAMSSALLGICLGTALSIVLWRVMSVLLGQQRLADVPSLLVACLGVLGISILATALPARTAAYSDPMRVLRSE